MRRVRRAFLSATVLLTLAVLGYAEDQEKAEKQIRMMTAMSRDDTARSIVSHTFSEVFKTPRTQLVQLRKNLNLDYGSLFVAEELASSGTKLDEITAQRQAGKTALDIAGASRADWKRIAADAKKMNNRINDAIYRHFLHSKPDEERDKAELYTASADLVRADMNVTRDEILQAQQNYVFWRNLAAPLNSGQADRNSALGRTYEQVRQDVQDTHGSMNGVAQNQ